MPKLPGQWLVDEMTKADVIATCLRAVLAAGEDLDSVACSARCYDIGDVDRANAVDASAKWREARNNLLSALK